MPAVAFEELNKRLAPDPSLRDSAGFGQGGELAVFLRRQVH